MTTFPIKERLIETDYESIIDSLRLTDPLRPIGPYDLFTPLRSLVPYDPLILTTYYPLTTH